MTEIAPFADKKHPHLYKWLTIFARILFGGLFIFSGFTKAIDPMGSAIKIEEYLQMLHWDGIAPWATWIAIALSGFEFLLGVNTFIGSQRRDIPRLDLLFMAVMTPLTLYLAIANPISDCGCFGDAWKLTNWETFGKNVILLALAIWLVKYNRQLPSVYNRPMQWLSSLYTVIFILAISVVGYLSEPLMDFRPYKQGVNILDEMSIPEGAQTSVYETTLIYEKDGVKKTFTLDNYPATDTTWHFVETINKEIKKGYVPPIENFYITNKEGDIVTNELLSQSGYTFVLLSWNVKTANDNYIYLVQQLYDYSVDQSAAFWGLSGSSVEETNEWVESNGIEFPFYYSESSTIKTIARSNPAVMLLYDGTIVWKKYIGELPQELQLKEPIGHTRWARLLPDQENRTLWILIFSFILPMLLILLLEKSIMAIVDKHKKRLLKLKMDRFVHAVEEQEQDDLIKKEEHEREKNHKNDSE